MAEKSRFFNSTPEDKRRYNADELAEVLRSFFSTGIIKTDISNSTIEAEALKIRKGTSGTLIVSKGSAMINGYWYKNDADFTLNIPSSGATPRKDLVVLRFDSAQRKISVVYLQGSANAEPTLQTSDQYYDIALAYVYVAPGGTQVITFEDRRRKFSQALYTLNLNEFMTAFNAQLNQFTTDSRNAITNLHANATEILTDYLEDEPSATRLFEIVLNKDGAGSGLDADLLDGKQGSYYLDYSNLTNKPTVQQTFSGTSDPAASLGQDGDIYIKYTG